MKHPNTPSCPALACSTEKKLCKNGWPPDSNVLVVMSMTGAMRQGVVGMAAERGRIELPIVERLKSAEQMRERGKMKDRDNAQAKGEREKANRPGEVKGIRGLRMERGTRNWETQ